ncbi:MAG: glycosyltransferase, partial [Ilumatobacteraceae bacterium]
SLHALCRDLGLDSQVHFLGQRNDVSSVLHASDVFCLPTEMDAFPLVFPEAMRAALPVVAARSGGVPEAVLDGLTGLLSLPRDLPALESNLRQMVVDRDRARAMGKAGRERLAEAFDPRTTGDRWMSVMESVAAVGRR